MYPKVKIKHHKLRLCNTDFNPLPTTPKTKITVFKNYARPSKLLIILTDHIGMPGLASCCFLLPDHIGMPGLASCCFLLPDHIGMPGLASCCFLLPVLLNACKSWLDWLPGIHLDKSWYGILSLHPLPPFILLQESSPFLTLPLPIPSILYPFSYLLYVLAYTHRVSILEGPSAVLYTPACMAGATWLSF